MVLTQVKKDCYGLRIAALRSRSRVSEIYLPDGELGEELGTSWGDRS